MTKSQVLGKNTSITEISNISSHGVWIYTHGQEFFLSFEDFPWFKDASVKKNNKCKGTFFWTLLLA